MAVTPDGSDVFVVTGAIRSRCSKHGYEHRWEVYRGLSLPWGVAVTPDGAYAYVTNQGSNSVTVISTAIPTR